MNNLALPITQDMLIIRENSCNLRNFRQFESNIPLTVRYGLETISYRSSNTWTLVPEDIKTSLTFDIFKKKIKLWKCTNCPCKLCANFVQNIGFI